MQWALLVRYQKDLYMGLEFWTFQGKCDILQETVAANEFPSFVCANIKSVSMPLLTELNFCQEFSACNLEYFTIE